MSVRKKKGNHSLELAITWLCGFLLLLVANTTIFRQLNASVGEPWFNYFLAMAALYLSVVIVIRFRRLYKEVKHANSQIERVDGMDDAGFAEYIMGICQKDGWEAEQGDADSTGAHLYLEHAAARLQAVLHTGRRRLTRDYILAVGSTCRRRPHPRGEAEVLCIANTSFTAQARREASRLGIRLMDRKALIDRLAKTDSAPIIPMTVRRR